MLKREILTTFVVSEENVFAESLDLSSSADEASAVIWKSSYSYCPIYKTCLLEINEERKTICSTALDGDICTVSGHAPDAIRCVQKKMHFAHDISLTTI